MSTAEAITATAQYRYASCCQCTGNKMTLADVLCSPVIASTLHNAIKVFSSDLHSTPLPFSTTCPKFHLVQWHTQLR